MEPGLQPLIGFLRSFIGRMRTDVVSLRVPPSAREKRWHYESRDSALTDADLITHLTTETSVGLYLLEPNRQDTCAIACVDLDDKKKELTWEQLCAEAKKVEDELLKRGLVAWPCRSGSGHGVHLWMFWEQPQPASWIRGHMKAAVKAAGYKQNVDLFPGQDKLPEAGKGSLVALPLSRSSRPIRSLATAEVREDLGGMLSSPPISPPVRDPEQGGGPSPARRSAKNSKGGYGEVDAATLDEALAFIENSQYEVWRDVGLALKRAVEDGQLAETVAQGAWERWSATAGNFDGRAQDYQWMRMRPDGSLTLGTVWKLAKDKGWKGGGGRQDLEGVPEEIVALNEKHFLCEEGGRVFIFREDHDDVLERGMLTRLNYGDFKLKYLNQNVVVGYSKKGVPIMEDLGAAWIKSPARRQYDRIVLQPEGGTGKNYNLWKGFTVEPSEAGSCEKFKRHLRDNLCRGDEKAYEYLMKWSAQTVQKPHEPIGTAVVMRGGKGTGKGTYARALGSLFGQHYMQVFSAQQLTGRFNSHLRDCLFMFADEAVWAGSKQEASVLAGLITEPLLSIEGKGRDTVTARNMLHMVIATNNEWSIPAGLDERRFFALHVGDNKQQDRAYFNAITEELRAGGKARLLWELTTMDLESWSAFDVPQTEELSHQKLLSLDPWAEWWYDKLKEGNLVKNRYRWTDPVPVQILYYDYVMQCRITGVRLPKNIEYFTHCLRSLMPSPESSRARLKNQVTLEPGLTVEAGQMLTFWHLPDLTACREFFAQKARSKFTWAEIVPEQASLGEVGGPGPRDDEAIPF